AQIYLNQPTGTLIQDERISDLEPVSTGDLTWGDYDNDGDLDLVLSGWNNEWEATLNLYTNAAGILRENTTFSATRVVGALAWGDYDNDGDLDLTASGQNSASTRFAYVLRNTAGTFTTDNTLNLEGLRGGDLAWTDHDNDGDLDLLIAGENNLDVRKTTLYNNSNAPGINTRPTPPDRLGTPIITGSTLTLN
ncbi:MAG: VCBS repeat-containing protein, partial [Lentisphaeria bacterium]|nr:VCBS repeat-containing protein [Lentisphaeria bacterium]